MGLTHFPHGVSSFGVPLIGSGFPQVFTPNFWFVDGDQGADGNPGKDPGAPRKTMGSVFTDAQFKSGDRIYLRGNIREQLVTPAGIFDVTIVGVGNRPRHADAHTGNNGYSAATWRAPASPVAGQANVRVIQQGWRFENILFVMADANSAGIEIVRNAGSGDAERDGSHCSVLGCRFAGAGIGIRSGVAGSFTEIVFNVEVAYCKFNGCTHAMLGINGNSWSIHHNEIQGCTNAIIMALQNSFIHENIVNGFTAAANSGGVDLNGGGGLNVVTKNFLGGAYSIAGGYRVSNANDAWWGNFADVTGGVTQADPA
jgi:hypothetical protein